MGRGIMCPCLIFWVGMQSSLQRSFGRAASHYSSAALFQPLCAEALFAGVDVSIPAPSRVLDLGCGVGMGSALLRSRWPDASVVAVDFSLPMLGLLGDGVLGCCARAEALPLASGVVDFLWSNLALQWCDTASFAASVSRVLRPGGHAAISTLGPATFPELVQAFGDGRSHTHSFLSAPAVLEAFGSVGLSVRLSVQPMTVHFPDLASLLFSIRGVGANHYSGQGRVRLGKAAYAAFVQGYEALRVPAGLPLTYEVFMVFVEKA